LAASSSVFGTRGQPTFPANEGPELGVDENTVSDFAAAVGTRRVGTTAERNALIAPELFVGLLWGDNTLGYDLRYTSTGWKRVGPRGFAFAASTGVDGRITLTHGYGSTPTWAQVSAMNPGAGTDEPARILDYIVWEITATTVVLRARRLDDRQWALSQPGAGFLTIGN